ncbi:unnamed protein product [Arabidopsis thaliana]|uniref:Uncharacterized protein n=1 Tax=Arabidopsis thaliana TaxID=3702 RepID=A0A654EQI5_ARATH|nr:unnamed protein product [Arabidopsis thaliana]
MDGKTLDGLSSITVNEEAAVEEALVVVYTEEAVVDMKRHISEAAVRSGGGEW